MGLRKGDEELALSANSMLKNSVFLPEVVDVFFHAEISADAAVEMDDDIAGAQFVKFGSGSVVGVPPFLAPGAVAVGEFCCGQDGELFVGRTKPGER